MSDGEVSSLLTPQRYPRSEQAKLHRIATDRGARTFDFRTFDEAQRHETLHQRIGRVDGRDDRFLTARKRRQRWRMTVQRSGSRSVFGVMLCH